MSTHCSSNVSGRGHQAMKKRMTRVFAAANMTKRMPATRKAPSLSSVRRLEFMESCRPPSVRITPRSAAALHSAGAVSCILLFYGPLPFTVACSSWPSGPRPLLRQPHSRPPRRSASATTTAWLLGLPAPKVARGRARPTRCDGTRANRPLLLEGHRLFASPSALQRVRLGPNGGSLGSQPRPTD